jgi:hypothetical protein
MPSPYIGASTTGAGGAMLDLEPERSSSSLSLRDLLREGFVNIVFEEGGVQLEE